jgi:hypothetical protein
MQKYHDVYYGFRFRNLSKEALMIFAESLINYNNFAGRLVEEYQPQRPKASAQEHKEPYSPVFSLLRVPSTPLW